MKVPPLFPSRSDSVRPPLFLGRSYGALSRWQGPWSDPADYPPAIHRETVFIRNGDRPLKAWLYTPKTRSVVGRILLVHGLHYLGPTDSRMDRFAHILASAGIRVLHPFLPDFMEQVIRPSVITDLERFFEKFLEYGDRPGIFSISFGSLPSFRLAANPKWKDRIGGLLTFGGYGDWIKMVRLALLRMGEGIWDPLSQPVLFMNLFPFLPGAPGDSRPLFAAWREFMRRTWGREEMKTGQSHFPVAREVARMVSSDQRRLFLQGCGVEPEGPVLFEEALKRSEGSFDFLTPIPWFPGIRCPVTVAHSAGDDVIPVEEADRICRALPPPASPRKVITGMISHSGNNLLGAGPTFVREIYSMIQIMRATISIARSQ